MSFPEDKAQLRDMLRQTLQELFSKPGGSDDEVRIKIDLHDIAKQLSTPAVDQAFRHYFAWNFRLTEMLQERARRAARDTYDFIDKEMRGALFEVNQQLVIKGRKDEIMQHDGYILDLGVYKGGSTRALAATFPNHTIHGFDSFEGLPEDWAHVKAGAFGEIKGTLPDMPGNVKLYKGWFDDTLPVWAEDNNEPVISLLRVDCDIYSSTKTIFDVLGHRLKPGCWICFDELIGYYGWQEHEHKAFMEFIDKTGFKYEYVAYGLTYTLVKLVD